MYQAIAPRIEGGMSAVDAPNGARIAYCDTYEQARIVAWALNVLTKQQAWPLPDQFHDVDARCPICQQPATT